jgi:hypothetical protein
MPYTADSFMYTLVPYKPTKSGIKEKNIVKFITNTKNKIVMSDCLADASFTKFKTDWDIFILWIDIKKKSPQKEKKLLSFFKSHTPLYGCFGDNYLLITKIVSKQIYGVSPSGCTVLGILDLYIYEMGGVLVEDGLEPLRKFKGTKYPSSTWNISPSDVKDIVPKMHGWLSRETELALTYVLQKNKHKVVVEVGSWLGLSTTYILQNMEKGTTLHCFDKFQNILKSPYNIKKMTKFDEFYLTTPRFETFCKNIAPHIGDKTCNVITHDINNFLEILITEFVTPDIIFINAVKNHEKLLSTYDKIFKYNKKTIIVGEDYIFEPVKKAVSAYEKTKGLSVYKFDTCYVMAFIKQPAIEKYIKTNKINNVYEKMRNFIDNGDSASAIKELKKGKIDINMPVERHNLNTIFTFVIIKIYYDKVTKLSQLRDYICDNYKPKAVPNILGLTYLDYMKNKNLIY